MHATGYWAPTILYTSHAWFLSVGVSDRKAKDFKISVLGAGKMAHD